jgi:hypothetical protein
LTEAAMNDESPTLEIRAGVRPGFLQLRTT